MSESDIALPVVIVLGAGIAGRAVATMLAPDHCVVVADRDLTLVESVVDPLLATGATAEPAVVDLTDLAAVTALRDGVLQRHGRIDAVVHLVGGWAGSTTVNAESITQFSSLLPGVLTTLQTSSVVFRDALLAADAGRFAMVTSTSVRRPRQNNAAYAAVKAAAETWTAALADSFRGSPARAVIVAVTSLVDDGMRAEYPDRTFKGATDTADLATAIRDAITGSPANGAVIDLSGSAVS